MNIKQALLNILDFNGNMTLISEKELLFINENVHDYIEKRIIKCQKSLKSRRAKFLENSSLKLLVEKYKEDYNFDSFKEISVFLTDKYYEMLYQANEEGIKDLLLIQYEEEEEDYLIFMMLTSKTGFTHSVGNQDSKMTTQILEHQALLPALGSKSDSFAIINLKNLEINFEESIVIINETETKLLEDKILQVTSELSQKEYVDTIKKITEEVSTEFGANSALNLSSVKNIITDSFKNIQINEENEEYIEIEDKITINPSKIAVDMFNDNNMMREKFVKKLEENKVPENISVDRKIYNELNKKHRIKTDNGIEISIPASYMNDPEIVQFINNDDGTISIELKNIAKIISRN